MNPAFWRDKRVFITGHTGFKGSWLSLWLQNCGAKVTGYSLSVPTSPSFFEVARVEEGISSVYGDVRDLERLSQIVADARPEIVIHMAAQSLVRRSYQEPVETYATNVMGTAHLLDSIRRTDTVKAVIIVTSDKCYENKEWEWGYRENDPLGGHDPYSGSKACAELVTSAFRRSFFSSADVERSTASIATARAGNVIGGGDWAEDRLIPDFIRSMMKGREIVVRNPDAIRPWQHVLDPLSGYLLLAEKLYEDGAAVAESWNFGPQEEDAKPVAWIIQRMVELWGDGASWALDKGKNPHEARYLKLDCSKARIGLGWRPQWKLEKALEASVYWYKAYQSGDNMRDISLAQILSYQETLCQEPEKR